MADEYKALTVIVLPFAEGGGPKTYQPGQIIPRGDFEANAEGAAAAYNDRAGEEEGASPLLDADGQINEFMQYGSLSDDADAPLHPSHVPPEPGTQNVASMVESARVLVSQLEEQDQDVPEELRALAQVEASNVRTGDQASSNDANNSKGA